MLHTIQITINTDDDFHVKIGCRELQPSLCSVDHDVGKDRDGVASFDNALDVVERFEECAAFDCDLHGTRVIES